MNDDTLLPCPFCGGEPIDQQTLRDGYEGQFADDPDAWAHFIICRSCAAQGGWSKSASGARRAWNMRAAPNKRIQPTAPDGLKSKRISKKRGG